MRSYGSVPGESGRREELGDQEILSKSPQEGKKTGGIPGVMGVRDRVG